MAGRRRKTRSRRLRVGYVALLVVAGLWSYSRPFDGLTMLAVIACGVIVFALFNALAHSYSDESFARLADPEPLPWETRSDRNRERADDPDRANR